MTYQIGRLLFLMFALFVWCLAAAGQSSFNYGFVSPNTREDLKLNQAITGMNSTDELSLMKQARSLGCVVSSKVRTFRALGSWSDGAEYSLLLRVNTDEPTVRYLLARLGREAVQKSVLYFHPEKTGEAKIYELRPTRTRLLPAIVKILDRVGIVFRTLVPLGRTTIVYIVDLKRELADKVTAAAWRLRSRVRSETGTAEFIGDESASKAKEIFDREISSYETAHPNLPPPCKIN